MHVLVASLPILGHMLPMEVVVRALLARGHQVTWATWATVEPRVRNAGAAFLPLTGEISYEPASMATWITRLTAAAEVQMADCGTFQCDRVLADATLIGVAKWAGEGAVPLHILGIIPFLGVSPHATMLWQTTIADFEPKRLWREQLVTFTGPLAIPTQWVAPQWWTTRDPDLPRIVITQGTLANDPSLLIRPTLTALAKAKAMAIVTADPDVIRHETAAAWVPLPIVLPGAAMLVTNGGYGGIQAALTAGVPVLVAGDTEEHSENGARVEYAGLGSYLPPPYTSERIQQAMMTILETPRFTERARELMGRVPKQSAAAIIADGVTASEPVRAVA
jgi:UDP:flavonoid glycosyltransferase YjiC (YdhE family)